MSTFTEEQPRHHDGRWAEHIHSTPEVGLIASGPAVVESPVSDRDRNFWVRLDEGQEATFEIATDGIGEPGRPWNDDTLSLKNEGGKLVSTFTVFDDNISGELDAVFEELDSATADELRGNLTRDIAEHTGGRGRIVFGDAGIELQDVTAHDFDEDGGAYTSNVMGSLERDSAYIYLRDGYYLPTVVAAMASYGYDG